MEHHLETKFNISSNCMLSEAEHIKFFTVNIVFVNVMCKVKHFFPSLYTHGTKAG